MTLQECTALLTTLALALRADIDEPTFRAYHRVLKDVPAPLAQAALDGMARDSERRFMPTAPEVLAACEVSRLRLLEAFPWRPCIDCEDSPGFCYVKGPDGMQPTATICPCKARHREMLAAKGAWLEPLCALPAVPLALAEKQLEAPSDDEAVATWRRVKEQFSR